MSQINQYLLNNIRTLEFFDFPLLFPYFMLFLSRILFPLHGCTPNIGHFSYCCCFLLCSLHMLIFIYMFTIFCSLLFLTHHFFHVQFPSSWNTSVGSSFSDKTFQTLWEIPYFSFTWTEFYVENVFLSGLEWYSPHVFWLLSLLWRGLSSVLLLFFCR